jgi:hypothetical protein
MPIYTKFTAIKLALGVAKYLINNISPKLILPIDRIKKADMCELSVGGERATNTACLYVCPLRSLPAPFRRGRALYKFCMHAQSVRIPQ